MMSLRYGLILIILVVCLEITQVTANVHSNRDLLQAVSGSRSLPRKTLSGGKVSSRFCGMDENGNCQWGPYAESIAIFGIPGLVLAALSLLALPVFLCGRLCCNTLGGRRRTKGVCCVSKPTEWQGYSKRSIIIDKIVVWVVTVGLIVFLIVGFVGNSKVNKGMSHMVNAIIDSGEELLDKATTIGNKLANLEYTKDAGSEIKNLVNSANDILDQGKDVRDKVKTYNSQRSSIIIASLVIPVVILALGSAAAIFNWKYLAFFCGLFCFFASVIVWIDFGVHFPVSTVFGDICYEIDLYLDTEDSNNPVLEQLQACKDGSTFKGISDTTTDALNEASDAACAAIDQLCALPNVQCTEACTSDNLGSFKYTIVEDYDEDCACNNQNVTISQCATSCSSSELQQLSDQFVTNLDLYIAYQDIILNDILPLLNCRFVYDTFEEIRGGLCDTMNVGVDSITTASGAMGVLLIAGTFGLIIGFKRFRPSSENSQKITDSNSTQNPEQSINPEQPAPSV